MDTPSLLGGLQPTPIQDDTTLANTLQGQGAPPAVVPASPVPAPQPQTQASPESVQGNIFGRVLKGLGGTHTEYAIDPVTGKTVATPVKESPSQTFRSILAYGLMGSRGIGHAEGEHTFTQGLLAGLGNGAAESNEAQQKLDQQRRAQAQQDYANQLKAAEEARQQKKLTMEETLNQVAIADHNQNIAARAQLMNQQAYSFAKEKGMDVATPLIQNSNLAVAADKSMVDGYTSLGVDPVEGYKNVTSDKLQEYLKDHPGATASQVALHTGTNTAFDPATGQVKVQELYSIYPPLTKVPPSLVAELKSFGADKPGNALNATYKNLTARGDGNVNSRDLMGVYKQLQSWEGLQKDSMELRLKQAEINKDNAEAWDADIRAKVMQLGFADEQQAKVGKNLFDQYWNYATNSLSPQAQVDLNVDGNDPKTNKPWTPQQKKDIETKKRALQGYVNGLYQVGSKDYADHAKEVKDADGNILSSNPQLGAEAAQLGGFAGANNLLLNNFKQPAPNLPANQPPPKVSLAAQGVMGVSTSLEDALTKVAQLPTPDENPNIGVTDQERQQIEQQIRTVYEQKQKSDQNKQQRVDALEDRLNQEKLNKNPAAFTPPVL